MRLHFWQTKAQAELFSQSIPMKVMPLVLMSISFLSKQTMLSPAPNYGEARSTESRKDFIHKMKISLKELRETMIWLKIISRKRMIAGEVVDASISECDELISIFVSSTRTADGG